MLQYSLQPLQLPLRYTWKISRNASDSKTNFVVTVTDGTYTGKGEIAPNVRYGESPDNIRTAFKFWEKQFPSSLETNLRDLEQMLPDPAVPHALRFGLESACLHYLADKTKTSPARLLGLADPLPRRSFYSLPIMPREELELFYEKENLQRFDVLKVKIARDNPAELVKTVASFAHAWLVVDANEAFDSADAVLEFTSQISDCPVLFLEQPLPSSLTAEQELLKKSCPLPVFADESVCRGADVRELARLFDGINVKLMKTGGYLEALRQLKQARELGLKTMLGCMVETSLGIYSALQLESMADYLDLDGFLIVKDEPFRYVQEREGKLLVNSALSPSR